MTAPPIGRQVYLADASPTGLSDWRSQVDLSDWRQPGRLCERTFLIPKPYNQDYNVFFIQEKIRLLGYYLLHNFKQCQKIHV
jgi:hypothetical protein